MNTQLQGIDVTRVETHMRTYRASTTRAAQVAANNAARWIASNHTTQRAALSECERQFADTYAAHEKINDARLKADLFRRLVVLSLTYEALRENDARVLRKTLATQVARRAKA